MGISSLDSRSISMLNYIVQNEQSLSVSEIANHFNLSVRTIYYDIDKVNNWFIFNGCNKVNIDRTSGLIFDDEQKALINELIIENDISSDYVFTPQERQFITICAIIASKEPLFIEEISTLCNVSRNSIFNDLKVIRDRLNRYDLSLSYENQIGYEIKGDSIRKLAVFLYYFNRIEPILTFLSNIDDMHISFLNLKLREELEEKLSRVEDYLKVKYVDGVIKGLSSLLTILLSINEDIILDDIDLNEIIETPEYSLVNNLFSELSESNKIYFSLHLLGSRIQISTKTLLSPNNPKLKRIAHYLVDEFERLAAVEFDKKDELINLISTHLSMSIYRYKYGIQLGNPLMEDIINSYPDLFDLTSKAVKSIRKHLQMPIPDSEIAYITLHFGGFMRKNDHRDLSVHVLLVCPNGISTSSILRAEIESLHPNIIIDDLVSVNDVEKYADKSDFIISTIDINSSIPVVKVKPIISEEDRINILSRVAKNQSIVRSKNNLAIDRIISVAKNYLSDKDVESFKRDIEQLYVKNSEKVMSEVIERVDLKDVLTLDHIKTVKSVDTLEDAIRLAAEPLRKEQSIKESYIYAMIDLLDRYGPYIVVAPNVALAHALPEDGVRKLSMSLLNLKEPTIYQNKSVKHVFVLAATDKNSHLKIMRDLLDFFQDERRFNQFTEYEGLDSEQYYKLLFDEMENDSND